MDKFDPGEQSESAGFLKHILPTETDLMHVSRHSHSTATKDAYYASPYCRQAAQNHWQTPPCAAILLVVVAAGNRYFSDYGNSILQAIRDVYTRNSIDLSIRKVIMNKVTEIQVVPITFLPSQAISERFTEKENTNELPYHQWKHFATYCQNCISSICNVWIQKNQYYKNQVPLPFSQSKVICVSGWYAVKSKKNKYM